MRTQKLKVLGSALVLAASIGTLPAFAHEEGGGEGKGMMSDGSGSMGDMMQMMSQMSPEDRKAMMKACMDMMQDQGMDDKTEAEPEADQ
ncbi:MAG: hypothetical protein CMH11_00725 [Maritimibacter sp.]|nr:hypothetical protein [Maritimibacter sp.]|tara:strand:+ start:294 stop:560 length:267 start_codon:yes stop_codon:yes gene_type:complete